MDEVIQQFKDGFPHGAGLYLGEDRPVFDLVDFDFRNDEGRILARGRCYPNKDFYFDFSSAVETEHGWDVKTVDGDKVFLYPLTPERGRAMTELLKDTY